MKSVLISLALALAVPGVCGASQEPQQSGPTASAPAFVRLDGELKTTTGESRTGSVILVVTLYATQDDPAPLWSEAQAVTLDAAGRYTVFAGATQVDGLPRALFSSNATQWIGVAVQGEPEQPRVRMVSVPYALSAGNADTLGGIPVTDFVMTENLRESVKKALNGDDAETAGKDGSGDPTTMGTAGRIAKFNSGAVGDIVDSVMFESGVGNIGIGTTNPLSKLTLLRPALTAAYAEVTDGTIRQVFGIAGDGTALLGTASTHNFTLMSAGVPMMTLKTDGNVGIGTSNPLSKFTVQRPAATAAYAEVTDGTIRQVFGIAGDGTALLGTASNHNFTLLSGGSPAITVKTDGNVGIGTSNPTSKLHIVGTTNITGDVTVGGNIGAKYQDVAEWVETGEPLEVGTVVIVAVGEVDQVVPSLRAYDTRVAGAVSRQPGLILGERGDSKSLIAQSGRVRIKVDATFGAIKPGDLLVTSSTPGHAMLSKPVKVGGGQSIHRPGTLVGKALEGLASGKGEILVLLTLQ